MLTDRFTARVLGLLVLLMTFIIDVSSLILSRPETRQRPSFFLIVLVPSLPLLALGIYLLRRANTLAESREDDR